MLFSGRTRLVVALLVSACYSVILIAWRGQTVGNRVVRTRVLSLRTAGVPTFSAAVIRWSVFNGAALISLLSSAFAPGYLLWLVVACVPILFTTFRQGIHDLAANVVVIDERIVSAYEQIAEMASGRRGSNDVAP
jgi:uncharacterized RDD family membrane protein YckC